MIKAKHVQVVISILEYFLFIMNGVVALRLIVQYVDLNQFIDYDTGRMSAFGRNIKFLQTMITKLTDPFIDPFKGILTDIVGKSNLELINILAPAFSIVIVLLIIAILKIFAPLIMRYMRKLENKNA